MRGVPMGVASGLLAVLGCGRGRAETEGHVPDALVIDCVGYWQSGETGVKFWGDHPDYEADYAVAFPNKAEPMEEFRYHVADSSLRLWRHRGRDVADVPFTLVRDESGSIYHYELRFDAPVFGHAVYQGTMSAGYGCTPRRE